MKVGVLNNEFSLDDEKPDAIELVENSSEHVEKEKEEGMVIQATEIDNHDNVAIEVDVTVDEDPSKIESEENANDGNINIVNEVPNDCGKTTVKRTVGIFGAISMIMGSMIGSGIFASTSTVFTHTKSVGLSLVVWGVSGILAVGAALCYVELGTMIPRSGGEFTYLRFAYGNIPAFLMTFTTTIILKPAQMAAIVLATGDYVTEPIIALHHDPANRALVSKLLAAFFLGIYISNA